VRKRLILLNRGRETKNGATWCAVGLLLVLFFQLLTSAVVKSPTFDEVLHALRGSIFLTTGDWRMQMNLHPPLVHLLTGILMWPVFPRVDPRQLEAWTSLPLRHLDVVREILTEMGYPSAFVPVFFGRIVVIGFTLILGALLFRWAKSWYGARAGLLALGVYTFAPNILAHGRLITTDMPVALTFFLAVYALQRFVTRTTYRTLLFAGFSLGLALGAKISSVILLPLFAVMLMPWVAKPDWLRTVKQRQGLLRFPVVWLVGIVGVALMTLWVIYGFEVGPYLPGWPALPLPTYMNTLATTFLSFYQTPKAPAAFLMGQRSFSGWWWYFPVTFLLKTPLPIVIASLFGFMGLLRERRWLPLWFGGVLPVVYMGMAVLNSWNLGYRYILPLEPFMILGIASTVRLFQSRRVLQIAGVVLLIWLVVGTIGIYPDYLAYFNELAGGPANGYRFLTDSNLDWGQDLIQLRRYMDKNDIQTLYLSYFGSVNPATYVLDFTPLPSFAPLQGESQFAMYMPEPGIYAISVTNLSGQYLSNPSTFDWFRRQSPVARVGYSIHIYDVPSSSDPAPKMIGVCATGAARSVDMPDDAELLAGFGGSKVHLFHIVCDEPAAFDSLDGVIVPAGSDMTSQTMEALGFQLAFQQIDFEGVLWFDVYLRLSAY